MRRNGHGNLRWIVNMILVTYASIAVSGCIETLSFRHVTAKQALLGESESEVLACAGPPRTVSSLDGLRA